MKRIGVRFDLSNRKGCHLGDGTPITSFVVRETDGGDEDVAQQLAVARGGEKAPGYTDELVRASIAEVNGEPVAQPYEAYTRWSSRARQFAFAAWREVNGVPEKEAEGFAAGGEVVEISSPAAK